MLSMVHTGLLTQSTTLWYLSRKPTLTLRLQSTTQLIILTPSCRAMLLCRFSSRHVSWFHWVLVVSKRCRRLLKLYRKVSSDSFLSMLSHQRVYGLWRFRTQAPMLQSSLSHAMFASTIKVSLSSTRLYSSLPNVA